MKPTIRTFLDDLYEIDPVLRDHEKDLIPLITQLLEHDPGREPDATFVQELRSKLQRRARELAPAHHSALRDGGSPSPTPSRFSIMSKLLYGIAGAAVAVLVAVPAVYYGTRTPSPAPSGTPLFSYNVTEAGDRAFGDLQTLQTNSRDQSGGGGGGYGGGGPVPAAAPSVPAQTGGGEDSVTLDTAENAKLIAPPYDGEYVQFNYQYTGELPELPEGTVSVLKRERGTRPALETVLGSFNLGTANLGSFGGSKLDSVTFSQESQYGYTVTLQLREGVVMINQNWEQWPHPENQCRDEACWQRFRVKIGDLPSDSEAIAIAKDFVGDHAIDVSQYGEPEVDNQWRRDYEAVADKSQAYVPETVTVVYPQLVDGRPVFDQGGGKNGIRVNVGARHKRVSDVWGLQSQTYTRSNYAAAEGSGAILGFLDTFEKIEQPFLPPNAKVKTVNVTLGTPTLGYATYFSFDKVPNEELVVPTLVFPVEGTSDPQQPSWRQHVIVPLAKELLERETPQAYPVDGPVLR